MIIMHEGSCLYVGAKDSRRVIADDVNLTEACELVMHSSKEYCNIADKPFIIGPWVRKVAHPRVQPKRKQSGTG